MYASLLVDTHTQMHTRSEMIANATCSYEELMNMQILFISRMLARRVREHPRSQRSTCSAQSRRFIQHYGMTANVKPEPWRHWLAQAVLFVLSRKQICMEKDSIHWSGSWEWQCVIITVDFRSQISTATFPPLSTVGLFQQEFALAERRAEHGMAWALCIQTSGPPLSARRFLPGDRCDIFGTGSFWLQTRRRVGLSDLHASASPFFFLLSMPPLHLFSCSLNENESAAAQMLSDKLRDHVEHTVPFN